MKTEEKIFFKICVERTRFFHAGFWFNDETFRDVINSTHYIPIKKMYYYLKKWSKLGIYDYGVSLDLGWFVIEKLKKEKRYWEMFLQITNKPPTNPFFTMY